MEPNSGPSGIRLTIQDASVKKQWDGFAAPGERLGEVATAAAKAMGTHRQGKIYFLAKNGIALPADLTVERSSLRNADVLELETKGFNG